jgi:hypothetical protein
VLVKVAHGQAMATAVGPQVPEIGKVPVPATTPCTFLLTFAKVSGDVPLSASAFAIEDEDGNLVHPVVAAYGGGRLPATVPAGKTTSITIKDVLPTGQGELRWAPLGGRPIVAWDFDVEID